MTGWSVSGGPGGGVGWESIGTVDGGGILWTRPVDQVDFVDLGEAREAAASMSVGTIIGPEYQAMFPEPPVRQYPRVVLRRPGYRPREMQIDRVEATDDGWKFTMHDPRWTFHGEGKFDDG